MSSSTNKIFSSVIDVIALKEVRGYRDREFWRFSVTRIEELHFLKLLDKRCQVALMETSLAVNSDFGSSPIHQHNDPRLRRTLAHYIPKFIPELSISLSDSRFSHEAKQIANLVHNCQYFRRFATIHQHSEPFQKSLRAA